MFVPDMRREGEMDSAAPPPRLGSDSRVISPLRLGEMEPGDSHDTMPTNIPSQGTTKPSHLLPEILWFVVKHGLLLSISYLGVSSVPFPEQYAQCCFRNASGLASAMTSSLPPETGNSNADGLFPCRFSFQGHAKVVHLTSTQRVQK